MKIVLKLPLFFSFVLVFFVVNSCKNNPAAWEFHYPGDDFTEESMLDLRYLNESYSGEDGSRRSGELMATLVKMNCGK